MYPIDEELLGALERIDEPVFGNAVGLDRLLMVVTGADRIDDVLLQPINKMFN